MLWTVGLRGLSDSSYATYDTAVANDNHALGRVIGQAMADQVRIVRAARPGASFLTNLWQEGARLVQAGDLQIPEGVHAVWADDGYGTAGRRPVVAWMITPMMKARSQSPRWCR